MSAPQRPGEPNHPPIADAASLFDSNEVHTLNPAPTAPKPPSSADESPSEYDLDALAGGSGIRSALKSPSTPPSRPTPSAPPKVHRPNAKPNTVGSNRYFDPNDDEDLAVAPPASGRPSSEGSPSDSAIRAARRSRHDADAESDSSDRAPSRTRKRKSERAIGFEDDDGDDLPAPDEPTQEVDPIWTRGAEWGPDLARVGLVLVATLALAYFAIGISFSLMALVLVLGGAAATLLSYPIAVTIERPVRMTPEQAVTDFFEAAGHHLPHYRRMWLLLSPAARSAGRFSNFGEFRTYWERQIAAWKAGRGGRFTPLLFRIVEFKGEKSAGQAATRVEYTVQVFIRGQEAGRPIASAAMKHGLVRGPDRMWYLNQGTLLSSGR